MGIPGLECCARQPYPPNRCRTAAHRQRHGLEPAARRNRVHGANVRWLHEAPDAGVRKAQTEAPKTQTNIAASPRSLRARSGRRREFHAKPYEGRARIFSPLQEVLASVLDRV